MLHVDRLAPPKKDELVFECTMSKSAPTFDPVPLLTRAGSGRTIVECRKNSQVFLQGDPADSVFYILRGTVKLTVVSKSGRNAVIAVAGIGSFYGEGCLGAQKVRLATATALTECSMVRLTRRAMTDLLRHNLAFTELFISHLLSRNIRVEEDLVNRLFNPAEKRLARVMILLTETGREPSPELASLGISQETLAEMIGTTRSRVNVFMNKFRRLGFMEYTEKLKIRSSLLTSVLND